MTEKGSFWKNNIKKLLEEKRLEERLLEERLEERLLEKQLKEKQLKEKQLKEKKARRKEEAKKKAKEAKEKKARRKEEAKKKAKEAKEKKERSRKAKIALMTKEKTVFNVLKSVVTDNEKKEQQKLQELWGISQEPPVECCKLLLDTNIIKAIFFDDVDAKARLRNYLKKKPLWGIDLLYLTLDRVIDEFIDERTRRTFGAEEYEYIEVCDHLNTSLGRFQDYELDTRSEYARKAEELYNKKIYIGKDGTTPISLVDCYLLEYAIEYSCKLVTRDKGLINATKKEIRLRSGESESTEGTSPGVFKPW